MLNKQFIELKWTINFWFVSRLLWASLVAQTVKRLSATRLRSLGWEEPLGKEMAAHSSIVAWKIPGTEEPARLQSMGSQRVGHDWATSLSKPKIFANERILLSSALEQKGKCLRTLFSWIFFLFLSFVLSSCSYTCAIIPKIKVYYQIPFHIKTENWKTQEMMVLIYAFNSLWS